jgi:hypothetical protein
MLALHKGLSSSGYKREQKNKKAQHMVCALCFLRRMRWDLPDKSDNFNEGIRVSRFGQKFG